MSSSGLKMKLSVKIAAMCLCIILTFCLAFAWLYAQSSQRQYKDRRLKVQHQVETAYGLLEHYAAEAAAGRLTQEDAQTQAKLAVKRLRYGDNDYFWINDTAPAMVMHPFKPELDGKDLSQSKDPNGKRLFVEFVEVCRKQGAGFVDYYWPKPGFNEPVAKISYVKLFPQWNWIIGNGLYIDDVEASLLHVLYTTLGLLAAVIVVTILLVVWVSRGITRPLRALQGVFRELALGHTDVPVPAGNCRELATLGASLKDLIQAMDARSTLALAIANGDLTRTVDVASERDSLGLALRKMQENLGNVLCQVQATAQQIGIDARQISAGSAELADGATRQASALEEISSSMQQIASQTGHNAENARQANVLAAQGRDAADKGNEEMAGMMAAMAEINGAAENISKIIKVIDEIAFQTNLLALNAAVEAARAGQHGKGFAVVAEEVRNLAARSAKAAKETEELIASSVAKTERGTVIADRTAAALREIVEVSAKVSALVGEIATASNEQAMGIGQINEGLNQIDQVNQQTTANTEESAASAAVLANHAEELEALLRQFRLDGARCAGRGFAAPPVSPAPKPLPARPAAPRPAPPRAPRPVKPVKAIPSPVSKGEQWGDLDEPGGAAPTIALDDDEFGKY